MLYDGVTPLDAIGAHEVLSRVPEGLVRLVAADAGLKQSGGRNPVGMFAEYSLAEVPEPGVIVIPGGPGARSMLRNRKVIDWLATAAASADLVTAIGTGTLLLAATGLLNGVDAATHWSSHDLLRELGNAVPSHERLVERGHVITAAGGSSAIDLALLVVRRLYDPVTAQAIQVMIDHTTADGQRPPAHSAVSPAVRARIEELTAHVRADPEHRAEDL